MDNSQVTARLATKLRIPLSQAEEIIRTVQDVFQRRLLAGGKIRLQGFGTFGTRNRRQRKTLNQKNKRWYVTERHQGPYFKPSPQLKQLARNANPAVIERGTHKKRPPQ